MNPIRTKENFLVFGSPLIEEAEIEEVIACLKSAWIGTGPRVAQFEADFAAYKGVEHAVALNSCTAALHLSLLAADLEPDAEVITTSLTFCATVNAMIHAGATPVLADVDPATMNIDPNEIERRITPRTRAIVPVHFAGRPCDMDAIMDIARRHNFKVIEDCAHAIETEYKGRKAGTFGDFGCFSFYVTKNIVTGEGGMVLADGTEDIARIKVLGLHGMSKDAWKRFGDEGYQALQGSGVRLQIQHDGSAGSSRHSSVEAGRKPTGRNARRSGIATSRPSRICRSACPLQWKRVPAMPTTCSPCSLMKRVPASPATNSSTA